MIIFYIILILLTFWGCKFSGKEFYKEDFLSKDSTLPVKGIFTWLVFFSHLPNYIKYTSAIDTYGRLVNTLLGQSIVAFILFCSGFGVFESFKKKGLSYARKMPKNRILKTLLHFDIAVLLFLIIQLLSGRPLSFLHIALSFTGWVSIGNSNWYIFVILALYLMTWLSFMFMKENIVKAGIMTTILSVALLILLGCTRLSFWYDTILCYILGIWVSVFKEKFIGLFTKKNSIWTASIIILAATFGTLRLCDSLIDSKAEVIFKLPAAPIFALLVIVLLTKIKVSNKVLTFSGKYLFEIYILQRIPMILFKIWGIADLNLYLYTIICIISTIMLAVVFRYFTDKIDSIIFRTKKTESL